MTKPNYHVFGAYKSQKDLVLEHLKSGRNLSQQAASNLYRVARLAARVKELKDDGYNIKSIRAKDVTGRYYALYRLMDVHTNPGVEGIY